MSGPAIPGDRAQTDQGVTDSRERGTLIPSLVEVRCWVHSEDCATHFDGLDDPTSACDCGYDKVLAMAVELHRLTHA